mmetsp:Transcript_26903/g.59544  ORF Transcript_26903/g.59544 Transcript_26903/m.59544 type:complete len:216 (-) Transcript_26903:28-675(-)
MRSFLVLAALAAAESSAMGLFQKLTGGGGAKPALSTQDRSDQELDTRVDDKVVEELVQGTSNEAAVQARIDFLKSSIAKMNSDQRDRLDELKNLDKAAERFESEEQEAAAHGQRGLNRTEQDAFEENQQSWEQKETEWEQAEMVLLETQQMVVAQQQALMLRKLIDLEKALHELKGLGHTEHVSDLHDMVEDFDRTAESFQQTNARMARSRSGEL